MKILLVGSMFFVISFFTMGIYCDKGTFNEVSVSDEKVVAASTPQVAYAHLWICPKAPSTRNSLSLYDTHGTLICSFDSVPIAYCSCIGKRVPTVDYLKKIEKDVDLSNMAYIDITDYEFNLLFFWDIFRRTTRRFYFNPSTHTFFQSWLKRLKSVGVGLLKSAMIMVVPFGGTVASITYWG